MPLTTSVTVQFNNAMNASTLDSTTLVLEDSSGDAVAANYRVQVFYP